MNADHDSCCRPDSGGKRTIGASGIGDELLRSNPMTRIARIEQVECNSTARHQVAAGNDFPCVVVDNPQPDRPKRITDHRDTGIQDIDRCPG